MNAQYQRVVLTGFMGAGKSTVGRLLAPLLQWEFVDADAHIEQEAGSTIAGLFRSHGEPHFREIESAAIMGLLARSHAVIALGGGALETAATRERLHRDRGSLLVYLETPLEVSLSRCRGEAGAAIRPVLEDAAMLEARFLRRLPLYQAAGFRIATVDQTAIEVAQAIANHVAEQSADRS